MDELGARAGRHYRLASYHGHPEADRVIIAMGSGAMTAAETAVYLAERGERVGVVQMRLYRPFPVAAFLAALPDRAAPGGVVLLNTGLPAGEVRASLPRSAQSAIVEKKLSLWAVDATAPATAAPAPATPVT
jgi:pyruvate/2-oxoacid:ferredoxin oxidoreductase alpha subunit